jgi:membrane protein
MIKAKEILQLFKTSADAWVDDKASMMGASLAYYTVFSVTPLLVIAIAISGLVFGKDAARGEIVHSISGLVGKQGGEAIQSLLQNASHPKTGLLATVIGLLTLAIGATGVFAQLQDSLNLIWKVKAKPVSVWKSLLKERLLSFAMVVAIAFLLLVSLVVSAALTVVGKFFAQSLPGGTQLWQGLNLLLDLGVGTVLFAMIYKVLPDTQIQWSDVWTGGAVTAILFSVGKLLIALYLGNSGVASVYGAAGSFVVLLVWVYYSSQVFLFGAEFTRAYAVRYGTHLNSMNNTYPLFPKRTG